MRKAVPVDPVLQKKHRQRVRAAKSLIDAQPPQISSTLLPISQMRIDAQTLQELKRRNMDLLMNFNRIAITGGVVATFAEQKYKVHYDEVKFNEINRKLTEIEKDNIALGRKLLRKKSELSTRWPSKASMHSRRSMYTSFKMPEQVMATYDELKLPRCKFLQYKLLRPKVYMDMEVKNVRTLGRITIQLYTEASPQVVLEFVRLCAAHSKEKIQLLRLFSSLWMEAELMLDDDSLAANRLEHDMDALDHGSTTGILSYSKCHLDGFKQGFINFSISFRPLCVLNGQRVAFGHVIRGYRLLDRIQDYSTKNGKPIKEIIITECGLYR